MSRLRRGVGARTTCRERYSDRDQSPHHGTDAVVKSPARFGGERLEPSRPSPDHGEHTEEVLREFAITPERIQQMTEQGVVA